MRYKSLLLFIFISLFTFSLLSQENEKSGITILNSGTRSEIIQIPLSSELHPSPNKKKWSVTVKPTFSRTHGLPEVLAIKESKKAQKLASYTGEEMISTKAVTPIVGVNFNATEMRFGTPPDNDMAISNGGIVVSVNNDRIEYYDDQGTFIYSDLWDDFIDDATLNSTLFDPKILYDSEADRFILVLLHGSNSSTTKVLTCFSQTNNPEDGWNIYQLDGNPLNDNSWLDYPSIVFLKMNYLSQEIYL